MKINTINKISFQSSQKINTFGYSDDISQKAREKMREDIIQDGMPFYSYWVKEPRLEEEPLNKLIKSLIGNKTYAYIQIPDIDEEKIYQIRAYNFCYIGNNSYRGGSLVNHPESLAVLKQVGIKRVIDITGNEEYKKQVEKSGLEYFAFKQSLFTEKGFWQNPVFQNEKIFVWHQMRTYGYLSEEEKEKKREEISKDYNYYSRDFIDNMIKLIKYLNNGYCYIGCEFGTYDTDDTLSLCNLLNPKAKVQPGVIFGTKAIYIKNLCSKLTPKDKKELGWDEKFESHLQKTLDEWSKREY